MEQEKTILIGVVWYQIFADGHAEAVGCIPCVNQLDLLAAVENVPVTAIADEAFSGNFFLTEVRFPDTLERIGKEAFRGCEKLRELTFPTGLKTLEDSCFAQCFQLRDISLPDSLETIADFAFKDCISLRSVTLRKNCREVSPTAFQECPSLERFFVTDDNEYFTSDDGILYNKDMTILLRCPETRNTPVRLREDMDFQPDAFDRCMWLPAVIADDDHPMYSTLDDGVLYSKDGTQLMLVPQGRKQPLHIEENVTDIAERALDQSFVPVMQVKDDVVDFAWIDCCSLPRFEVSEYNPAFCDVEGILYDKEQTVLIACYGAFKGVLELPDTVTMIDCGAVSGCGGVTGVVLPDALFLIDNAAFACCTALKEADIPSGVTTIGDEAFLSCFSLETVRITNPDTEIGTDAFLGCLNLTIYAPNGSTAEEYANTHEIAFQPLETSD